MVLSLLRNYDVDKDAVFLTGPRVAETLPPLCGGGGVVLLPTGGTAACRPAVELQVVITRTIRLAGRITITAHICIPRSGSQTGGLAGRLGESQVCISAQGSEVP